MHLIICFFLDCLDISSQDLRPVRKNARWIPHIFFNNAPPIRATRNGHMGCWKSKTWKGLWKACRKFDFIQDKQPFLSPSNLSEKRRASSDIAPVSSHNRTAMCIFFQNNCSILQKHSSSLIIIDFGFIHSPQPHPKSRSPCQSPHLQARTQVLHTTRKMTIRTMRMDCGRWYDSFSFLFHEHTKLFDWSFSAGIISFQDVHIRVQGPVSVPEEHNQNHTS